MFLKNQILSNLTLDGKKSVGEKILYKFLKNLYKNINKNIKIIVCLILSNSTPLFKINKPTNSKTKQRNFTNPIIIWTLKKRVSLSIKIILTTLKKKKSSYLYIKLSNEVASISNVKSKTSELKNILQKQALLQKHLFFYYKWK